MESNDKKTLPKLDNMKKIIIIAGFLGIALILLSNIFTSPKDKKDIEISVPKFDADAYRIELESRLADIISHIDGAGNTGVMITLEGGREYVYAQNTRHDTSSDSDKVQNSGESEYYTVKSDSQGETPILVYEREPKVRGVIVVCSGGGNEAVREKIIEAVSSIFSIPKTNISVSKISQ